MLLYSDVLTEDEMFSDAFPMYVPRSHANLLSISLVFFRSISLPSKLVDDIVYEVDCQLTTVKAGADVDIGLCTASLRILHSRRG